MVGLSRKGLAWGYCKDQESRTPGSPQGQRAGMTILWARVGHGDRDLHRVNVTEAGSSPGEDAVRVALSSPDSIRTSAWQRPS